MHGLDESSACPTCESDDWSYSDAAQTVARCNSCGAKWGVLSSDDIADIGDVSQRD